MMTKYIIHRPQWMGKHIFPGFDGKKIANAHVFFSIMHVEVTILASVLFFKQGEAIVFKAIR